jgi:hypothetical protein
MVGRRDEDVIKFESIEYLSCSFWNKRLYFLDIKYDDQKSVRILPFNIAAMEKSILPVERRIIPMTALPIVKNNLFVSRTVTYRNEEK